MRNLRIATLGLGLVLAIAGAAAALHVTMNASHSAATEHGSASGDGGLDLGDDGLSVATGLAGDHAALDGAATVTLPDAPEAPALPTDVPDVGVPTTADAPELPDVSGSGNGAAGATTQHGNVDAAGGVALDP